MAKNQKRPISRPMLQKAMMAEKPKKTNITAYALKSDNGENEDHQYTETRITNYGTNAK